MKLWFKKREAEKLITDWAPIDRIDAFRLGQWAAVISGYDFVADINDDPALRPWKHEFFFIKRRIESAGFKLRSAPGGKVDRTTLAFRDEIEELYRAEGRCPPQLFVSCRPDVWP